MAGSGRVWDKEEPRTNLKGFHLQRWKRPAEGGGWKETGEQKTHKILGHDEVGVFVSVTS